jgi:hypothetical protein
MGLHFLGGEDAGLLQSLLTQEGGLDQSKVGFQSLAL